MLDWAQLKGFHRTMVSNIYERKPDVIQAYQQCIQTLKDCNISLTAYLLDHIFHPSDHSLHPASLWKLVPNDYPYSLTPGINHLIFWIHPQAKLSSDEAELKLEEELFRQGYGKDEFVYFQNVMTRRSVPGIEYYQVFTCR